MFSLRGAAQLTSSFGGMFSYGDCNGGQTVYVNNLTGGYSCPSGYTQGPNLESLAGCSSYPGGGCGFRTLYELCGYSFWFCYNGGASNMDFGGMYQVMMCNQSHDPNVPTAIMPNIGNPAVRPPSRGLYDDALGCPQGFFPIVAAIFSSAGTECPSTTFACVTPFNAGFSTLGGFYQDNAFPNPYTGDYSCPAGYSSVPFATSDNYNRGDSLSTAYYCYRSGSPAPPTPPTPSVSSTCCYYFRTEDKYETSLCQKLNHACPSVTGFFSVGNSTVTSCAACAP
jgi:hypothetical protein